MEKILENRKKYIKNPLPLPKKHIHRTLDYAFEPAIDRMKFDLDIKDDDDYEKAVF